VRGAPPLWLTLVLGHGRGLTQATRTETYPPVPIRLLSVPPPPGAPLYIAGCTASRTTSGSEGSGCHQAQRTGGGEPQRGVLPSRCLSGALTLTSFSGAELQQPVAGEHQQRQPEAERQPDVLQLIGSHERSDESGSDSSEEESDVPSPAQDSGAVAPQPLTRAAARRRRRQRQGVDLADALAHARWVAAGSHDYRSMTLRQLRTHARARFGPQFWQELETRGNRRTALVNLLYSTDGGGH